MSLPERPSIDQAMRDEFGPMPAVVSYPDLFGDTLFLDHAKWNGVPVTLATFVPDGQIVSIGRPVQQIIIGSRPRTDLELARHHARWIVQNGLRDVVEWLGERVIPERPVTGAEILEGIRRGLV